MVAASTQGSKLRAVGGELCSYCANFKWKPSLSIRTSESPGPYRHHSSWKDLLHSAKGCPLCKMIEHEILQSCAFRSLNGARVQILAEEFVRNRGAFTIDGGTENRDLDVGIRSPIYLTTQAGTSGGAGGRINIDLPDWDKADAVDRARDKTSYTDWHEEYKRTTGRRDYPGLDVFTYIG